MQAVITIILILIAAWIAIGVFKLALSVVMSIAVPLVIIAGVVFIVGKVKNKSLPGGPKSL